MGNIYLMKDFVKNESYCLQQNNSIFNYYGIQNALCSKQPNEKGEICFIPKRIIVIRME